MRREIVTLLENVSLPAAGAAVNTPFIRSFGAKSIALFMVQSANAPPSAFTHQWAVDLAGTAFTGSSAAIQGNLITATNPPTGDTRLGWFTLYTLSGVLEVAGYIHIPKIRWVVTPNATVASTITMWALVDYIEQVPGRWDKMNDGHWF
jgi:hypothetical protein